MFRSTDILRPFASGHEQQSSKNTNPALKTFRLDSIFYLTNSYPYGTILKIPTQRFQRLMQHDSWRHFNQVRRSLRVPGKDQNKLCKPRLSRNEAGMSFRINESVLATTQSEVVRQQLRVTRQI